MQIVENKKQIEKQVKELGIEKYVRFTGMIPPKKTYKYYQLADLFVCASTSETRPVLTGINFKIEGNTLECTATDSYRLAVKKLTLETNVTEKINIIIPTKNLNELIKLMSNDEENIEMHIFGNKVIFKFSEIIMMTRLVSGT